MFDLKKLFPKSAAEPLTIAEALRDFCFEGTHVAKGSKIELSAKELANFGGSDIKILSRPAEPQVIDPTLPRQEPDPAPERWKSLPECFSQWWDIDQKFKVARKHLDLLAEARVNAFGTDTDLFASTATYLGSDGVTSIGTRFVHVNKVHENSDRNNQNISISQYRHDLDSPEFRKLVGFHR